MGTSTYKQRVKILNSLNCSICLYLSIYIINIIHLKQTVSLANFSNSTLSMIALQLIFVMYLILWRETYSPGFPVLQKAVHRPVLSKIQVWKKQALQWYQICSCWLKIYTLFYEYIGQLRIYRNISNGTIFLNYT